MSNSSLKQTSVCQPAPLRLLPGHSKDRFSYCPLPTGSVDELLYTFQSAPQFSGVQVQELMEEESLRVLLFGSDSYYLRQAAVYLSAIHAGKKPVSAPNQNDFWNNLDFSEYIPEEENGPDASALIEKNLTVVSPALLDPEIAEQNQPSQLSSAANELKKMELLRLDSLDTTAILVAADSGTVLTEAVMQQIEATIEKENPVDLFIAIKPEQEELDFLEELRFTHGFHDCQIGQVDMAYLRCFLRETADDLLIPLDESAELDQVIMQLRRYRGNRFTEVDLRTLLTHAANKNLKKPLKTSDLIFSPRKSQRTERGLDKLESMIGLESVKNALHRLLATATMEDRSRMHGLEISPSCRNMAFSGPPGTGKSVTARLVAQIMREEGCGSGRFVEAGREQLIGAYLGHTSPMITKLFQQAKGGVLFIDEAGALLNHGHNDTYATESVNALVRHMELEPETIVIFATYPEEMKQLLVSNPGLSSRVAQVLDFKNYDDAQLFHIFCDFAQKEGFAVKKECEAICNHFFHKLKERKAETFGNGREARRLFQAAKEELAVKALTAPETAMTLNADILTEAAERLLEQEQTEQHSIGFLN